MQPHSQEHEPHGWWRNPENTYVNKASQRMAGCLAGSEVEEMSELLVNVKSVGTTKRTETKNRTQRSECSNYCKRWWREEEKRRKRDSSGEAEG